LDVGRYHLTNKCRETHGCSLKIYRVEISVAGGKGESPPCRQQLEF